MKTSTLNYLNNLPCSILHIYHTETKTGYWRWISEICHEVGEERLQKPGKVTVSIPLSNILDTEAVDRIKVTVNIHFKTHYYMQKARQETLQNPNWAFEHKSLGNKSTITILPKNPSAQEVNPISGTIQANTDIHQKIFHALEKGIPIDLSTSEHGIRLHTLGLPEWMEELYDGDISVTLLPHVDDIQFPVMFQFLDVHGKNIFDLPPFILKLVQQGTKLLCWEGEIKSKRQRIKFTLDASTKKSHFDYDVLPNTLNPIYFKDYWQNYILMGQVTQIIIKNLEDNSEIPLDVFHEIDDLIYVFYDLANWLTKINQQLNLDLPYPELFSDEEIEIIRRLHEIITTGKSFELFEVNFRRTYEQNELPVVIGHLTVDDASQIIEKLSTYRHVYIQQKINVKEVDILGQKIDLNEAFICLNCYEILGADKLQEALNNAQKDDMVEIKMLFNQDESFIRFPKWDSEILDNQ